MTKKRKRQPRWSASFLVSAQSPFGLWLGDVANVGRSLARVGPGAGDWPESQREDARTGGHRGRRRARRLARLLVEPEQAAAGLRQNPGPP